MRIVLSSPLTPDLQHGDVIVETSLGVVADADVLLESELDALRLRDVIVVLRAAREEVVAAEHEVVFAENSFYF